MAVDGSPANFVGKSLVQLGADVSQLQRYSNTYTKETLRNVTNSLLESQGTSELPEGWTQKVVGTRKIYVDPQGNETRFFFLF